MSTMLAILLSFAALLPQDRDRIDQLLKQAEDLNEQGKTAEALPLLAEAWALTSEVYWRQGNLSASGEAWRRALQFGWKGESPAQKQAPTPRPVAPPPPAAESAPPPMAPAEVPAPRVTLKSEPLPPPAARPQEPLQETPRYEPRRVYEPPRRRRPLTAEQALWETFALAPYASPRNNGWHSLVNTPGLEAATVIPREMHHLRLTVDWASIDYADSTQGGVTNWDAQALTQHVEYNYGLSDEIQVGGRLSFGQLLEGNDSVLTVFENGTQIVPTGTRGFGIESLVLRGKWATTTDFADLGALVEFKIPLGNEEDYLTAQTFDIGISGLLSKRWDRWAVHVNGGVVFPFGDVDLFVPDPDADMYFHGGVAISYLAFDSFSIFVQGEYNTAAFGDVTLFDEPVTVVSGGARYKVAERVYFGGAIGTGLSDESGDFSFSGGLDVLF